jgi:hypothetical protein
LQFQVAPKTASASQSVCTGPPERSIFFSRASEKKAMNGCPATRTDPLRDRCQPMGRFERIERPNPDLLFSLLYQNHGDGVPETASDSTRDFSGTTTLMRIVWGGGVCRRKCTKASAANKGMRIANAPATSALRDGKSL